MSEVIHAVWGISSGVRGTYYCVVGCPTQALIQWRAISDGRILAGKPSQHPCQSSFEPVPYKRYSTVQYLIRFRVPRSLGSKRASPANARNLLVLYCTARCNIRLVRLADQVDWLTRPTDTVGASLPDADSPPPEQKHTTETLFFSLLSLLPGRRGAQGHLSMAGRSRV